MESNKPSWRNLCQRMSGYSQKRNRLSNKKEGMERGEKGTTPIILTCERKMLKQVNGKLMRERKSIVNLW